MYSKNNKGNQTELMVGGVCSYHRVPWRNFDLKDLIYFAHCSDAVRTEARGFQGN